MGNLGKKLVLDGVGFGELQSGLLEFLIEGLQVGHGGAEIGVAHQIEVQVKDLAQCLGVGEALLARGKLIEQLLQQERTHHPHCADDIFLVERDAHMAETDLEAIFRIVFVIHAVEQPATPSLERGLEP